MNWRKPLISLLLGLSGSSVLARLRHAGHLLDAPPERAASDQEERLRKLLAHAAAKVPFHAARLEAVGVARGGQIDIERLRELPLLDKQTVREHFNDLRAIDASARRPYENFSGGSTGEPIRLVQDRAFREASIANTLLFLRMAGKDIGESELKLWGSERDIIEGSAGIRVRLHNFLYGRLLLNSFRMGEREMRAYAMAWQNQRPKVVWCYVDSIHEFARFVERNQLALPAPRAVVTTAGTLHQPVREFVEAVLNTRVLDQYGSREAGIIGCQPLHDSELRVFTWSQWIEILDDAGRPCPPGEPGRIVVTNLDNYAMPLIRYQIGDLATAADEEPAFPGRHARLASIDGRISDHFRAADGSLVHGEYFTHLFYGRDWVDKFQVVQQALDRVVVRYVPRGAPPPGCLDDLTRKVRLVLGEQATVEFIAVDAIPPLSSGKFRFTICELDTKAPAGTPS